MKEWRNCQEVSLCPTSKVILRKEKPKCTFPKSFALPLFSHRVQTWQTCTELISSALCSTENPVVKDPSWSCSRSCSQEVSAGLAQRTTSESRLKNSSFSINVKSPTHLPRIWKYSSHSCSRLHRTCWCRCCSWQNTALALWKRPEDHWQCICVQDLDDASVDPGPQTEMLPNRCEASAFGREEPPVSSEVFCSDQLSWLRINVNTWRTKRLRSVCETFPKLCNNKLRHLHVLHPLKWIKTLTSNVKVWTFSPFSLSCSTKSLYSEATGDSDTPVWPYRLFEFQTNKSCCFHDNTINFCSLIFSALCLNYE